MMAGRAAGADPYLKRRKGGWRLVPSPLLLVEVPAADLIDDQTSPLWDHPLSSLLPFTPLFFTP